MITFAERVVNGMPVVTIRVDVTAEDYVDTDSFTTRWNRMYTDHAIFSLELDFSQLDVLTATSLLPTFIPVAKRTRPLSEKQVFKTGICLPWYAKPVYEYGIQQYPPVRPVLLVDSPIELQMGMEQIIHNPKYRDAQGAWIFPTKEDDSKEDEHKPQSSSWGFLF